MESKEKLCPYGHGRLVVQHIIPVVSTTTSTPVDKMIPKGSDWLVCTKCDFREKA